MKEHGGNIYAASQKTGIPEDRILDFSASVNPLGVPKSVAVTIRENIKNLPNYPEPFAEQLSLHLGRHLGIDARSIICGNGSTELIYLVIRALDPEKVLIPAPTFSEYERACGMQRETRVVRYGLRRENNFDLNLDEFIAAMDGCNMAFICNPNNPTGRLLTRDEALKIAHAAERLHCCLVVDEAFIDFVPEHSVITDVERNPYLIVLRSLTKFYALSGLRIGYGVFPGALIERVKKYKEPWTVNTLAQRAGMAAIKDTSYETETFGVLRKGKKFLENGLNELGIEYVPSAINYYLIRLKNAQEVIVSLRGKGILVRDCSNFAGLDGSYIRIAVKSVRNNALLLKELSALCRG
jgi:threonine-phosphate decarboxylase